MQLNILIMTSKRNTESPISKWKGLIVFFCIFYTRSLHSVSCKWRLNTEVLVQDSFAKPSKCTVYFLNQLKKSGLLLVNCCFWCSHIMYTNLPANEYHQKISMNDIDPNYKVAYCSTIDVFLLKQSMTYTVTWQITRLSPFLILVLK